MALTLQQFEDDIKQSRLLTAEEVMSLCDRLPSKRRDDVQELAKLLVRERKLTRYQGQANYQGGHQALRSGEYTILEKLGEGGLALEGGPFRGQRFHLLRGEISLQHGHRRLSVRYHPEGIHDVTFHNCVFIVHRRHGRSRASRRLRLC